MMGNGLRNLRQMGLDVEMEKSVAIPSEGMHFNRVTTLEAGTPIITIPLVLADANSLLIRCAQSVL